MSYTTIDDILKEVEGLTHSDKSHRFTLTSSYVNTTINVVLATLYKGDDKKSGEANAKEILDRCSRQVYDYIYDQLTWPEDYDKKQYLISTDANIVRVLRDIMLSHIEAVVLSRRDLLVLEHGVDFDGNKLIEDYEQYMEMYQFATGTRRIFNQHRVLRYKERLTTKDIDPSLIRNGY